ncbi:MAG: peptide ABC transporter substrate-binding protein [Oligoflexia bacterium]|nr:peptide ABC transporter substrate-binding protein [Oligoflexia bacterium]
MRKALFLLLLLITATSHGASLRFPLSVSLEVFDPTEAEDFVTIRVLMNLGSGLMRSKVDLTPELELAKSYKVTNDGKTYTFKLKKTFWSDGTPILSDDFIYALKRTLSPNTKAKISQTFQDLIENAREYKTSKINDFSKVGIKKIDDLTLEFKLNHPSNYFLSLLTLPFTFPMKPGFETIKPNTPTSGRYIISDFKRSQKILLKPNLKHLNPAKNNVELKFILESSTLVALFEKNEIDVIEKVPSSDFIRFKNNPALKTGPFLATYYLGFNTTKKPFDDVNLRKLVISNINREEINKILQDPQKISSSWVPTPLLGSNKTYEIKKIKSKTKDFDFELVFDSQEKNTLIATLIQNQIKKNLNYNMPLKSMEWKSYLKHISQENPSFFRFAWLAAFPDPVSHLSVFKGNNPNNYTGYNNPRYNELVDQISKTTQMKKREALIRKAQNLLLIEDAVIMPLYHYVQYFLVSNKWTGLNITPMGLLYFDQATPKSSP